MLFERENAALLLIDLQVGFCSPDGHTGKRLDVSGFQPVLQSARRLIDVARETEIPVICTTMAFAPDYSNGGLTTSHLRPELKPRNALRADMPDAEIMPELGLQPEDTVIEKQRYSAMIKSPLPALIEERGYDSFIVGGVTTSMCVESTVRDLGMMDYRTFIVPETCGDLRPDYHERSLQMFASAFGRVVPEVDMIEAMRAGQSEFPHQTVF